MNWKHYLEQDWKKLMGYLVAFMAMFAFSALASFSLLIDRFTLEIPDLVGRDYKEVNEMLSDMALLMTVTGEEYDMEIEAGHVLRQSEEPGKIVRGQAVIAVVISKGAEVRLIPSVIGMEYDDAAEVLREGQLLLDRVIRVHTGREKEGTVLAQYPEPDELTGQPMTLLVSSGPRDVIYYNPYFLGMAKMDALMLARDLRLSVRITELDNTSTISYQSPSPGAEIRRGDVLKLRVGG